MSPGTAFFSIALIELHKPVMLADVASCKLDTALLERNFELRIDACPNDKIYQNQIYRGHMYKSPYFVKM